MAEGLLDFLKTPEGQGLLSGVFGYAANARRGTPWNNIGRGGVAGLMGYGNALERQDTLAQRELQKKLLDAQVANYQSEADARNAKATLDKNRAAVLPTLWTGGQDARPAFTPVGDSPLAPMPATPAVAPKFDYVTAAKYWTPQEVEALSKMPEYGKPEAFTLGKGQVRYQGDKVVARGPDDVPEPTTDWRNYLAGLKDPRFASWLTSQQSAKAPKVAVDLSDPTAKAKAAMDFQNQVRSAFKDDETIAQQYNAMREAVSNPSAQGDTALLYSFFKVLDPASTVREGELDLVMSSRSISDKLKGYATRLANGQTLTPAERADLLKQAERQVTSRVPKAERERKNYSANAQMLQLNPDDIVPNPYFGISIMGSGQRAGGAQQTAPKAVISWKDMK